jgi:hypothetical protein
MIEMFILIQFLFTKHLKILCRINHLINYKKLVLPWAWLNAWGLLWCAGSAYFLISLIWNSSLPLKNVLINVWCCLLNILNKSAPGYDDYFEFIMHIRYCGMVKCLSVFHCMEVCTIFVWKIWWRLRQWGVNADFLSQ